MTKDIEQRGPSWRTWIVGLALGLLTFLIYYPVRTHDFQRMDDGDYVFQNPHVTSGVKFQNVEWAFTHRHSGNWHPLTWISHMLDCQIFGVNAGAHLLVNAGLHALNSLVLLLILRRLTGAFWRSAFVAGLFALHPLHVESVAWVAERKDVLSTMFWFLTIWAYVRYMEKQKAGEQKAEIPEETSSQRRLTSAATMFYLLALAFLALGLMSKPMLVTLPFTLLLLDYWPLERMRAGGWRRLVLEKAPFLALAAASSVVTLIVQGKSGAVVSLNDLSLELRLGNVVVSYVRYLMLMVAPMNLAVFYPLPRVIPTWQIAAAGLVLIVITVFAIKQAKSRPYLLVGWLWYLGTLVPVIGFIKAGEQAIADRYTYVPLIGIFVALAWGLRDLAIRAVYLRKPTFVVAIAALIGCAMLTRREVGYWKDSRTLYQHAAEVTTHNYAAMMVLGGLLWQDGKLPEAKATILEGLKDAPRSPDLHNGLGFILIGQKQYDEALPHFQQALSVAPDLGSAFYGSSYCLFQQQKYAESEAAARRAWELSPEDYKAGLLLALSLQSQQRSEEAAEAYRKVLASKPGCAPALRGLANLAASAGKTEEALQLYSEAVTAEPKDVEGHNGLAAALANQGRIGPAILNYEESLRLDSAQPQVHFSVAELLSRMRRTSEAIAHYREGLKLQPEFAAALNNLAWLLATNPDPQFRDGKKAVRLAELACEQTQYKVPVFLGTLAAAYAEDGRFKKAIATAGKARDLAEVAGLKAVADRNRELLQLYLEGKAYREPLPPPSNAAD